MKVLVWKDKHGTSYYDASTPEALAESALNVLGTMMDIGYYYREEKEFEVPITDEEIEAMPLKYRDHARKDQSYAKRSILDAKENNDFYDEVKRVLAEHDMSTVTIGRGKHERQVPIAWNLLDSRSDYEYEYVSLEDVWQPESVDD